MRHGAVHWTLTQAYLADEPQEVSIGDAANRDETFPILILRDLSRISIGGV